MRHRALLLTAYSEGLAQHALLMARDIYGREHPDFPFQRDYLACVSQIQQSAVNSYWSFAIFPDGSKEFWPDSDESDKRRAEFIAWIKAQAYEDGSSPYAWAEVQYGDEEQDNRLLDSDCGPQVACLANDFVATRQVKAPTDFALEYRAYLAALSLAASEEDVERRDDRVRSLYVDWHNRHAVRMEDPDHVKQSGMKLRTWNAIARAGVW